MKFLIIQKVNKEVPLDKWAKFLPLQFNYFKELQARGILEVYYHLIGQQGSMLVVNVDSDETLSKLIGEDPMFFYLNREIYPLITQEFHQKQIKELISLQP